MAFKEKGWGSSSELVVGRQVDHSLKLFYFRDSVKRVNASEILFRKPVSRSD